MFFQHQSPILRKSEKEKREDQSVGVALKAISSDKFKLVDHQPTQVEQRYTCHEVHFFLKKHPR